MGDTLPKRLALPEFGPKHPSIALCLPDVHVLVKKFAPARRS